MMKLYISTNGNDRWSGARVTPNAEKSDGPLASLAGACRALRDLKGRGGFSEPVTVFLRGGEYPLEETLRFSSRDSGTPSHRRPTKKNPWGATPECPVYFKAYRNEKPVVSGGRVLSGWREETLNGNMVWVADVPVRRKGQYTFRQLWVNGRRALRPVMPREGFYRLEAPLGKPKTKYPWRGGHAAFRSAPGDVQAWSNLEDVEIAVYNYWIESRMHIRSFDLKTRRVELDRHCQTHLKDEWGSQGAQYRVEGALEHLHNPGEWCVDSRGGLIYYRPMPGERISTSRMVIASLQTLIEMEGEDQDKKPVELIEFEGIRFAFNEWQPPADYSASNQAAWQVPGAIRLKNARRIAFRSCVFSHLGSYGIECDTGCFDVTLQSCAITDLAGGGIKVWHGNSRITIRDNEIAQGGRLYGQGIGVLVGQSSGVQILHNHIHDFHYSGISLGWCWGYQQGNAYGNVVEYNHVHDLGHGLLSDMGGIYTLGPQPGTRIRYNYFHHVDSRTYGGWGIYTDEGSSDILIENNLAAHTKCGGFHQHYGCNNLVRNNIFAWSQENQLARSRLEPHSSFTFECNIVLIDSGLFWKGNWSGAQAVVNRNLYWDTRFGRRKPPAGRLMMAGEGEGALCWSKWNTLGLDVDSVVADPGLVVEEEGQYRLGNSAAVKRIGFIPFDLSGIGPRSGCQPPPDEVR